MKMIWTYIPTYWYRFYENRFFLGSSHAIEKKLKKNLLILDDDTIIFTFSNFQKKNKESIMPSYPAIKLTYFDIEAAAEPTRLAFTLAGIPFEDVRVQFKEWADMKGTTPYGQLPLLNVDGGPTKTQSGAMLRYAGSLNPEAGLYPTEDLYKVEEAMGLIEDMRSSWVPMLYIAMRPHKYGYPEEYSKTAEGSELVKTMRQKWIKEELPTYLGYLTAMIEKNGGKWLASSDKPTIADCFVIPTLRSFTRNYIDHVDPTCLDDFPVIVDYVKRFCALDAIKGRYTDGLH